MDISVGCEGTGGHRTRTTELDAVTEAYHGIAAANPDDTFDFREVPGGVVDHHFVIVRTCSWYNKVVVNGISCVHELHHQNDKSV